LRSIAKSWDNFPRFGKGEIAIVGLFQPLFGGFARFFEFGTRLVQDWTTPPERAGQTKRFKEAIMFNFKSQVLHRAALAAIGTLILTTTAVTAAVGPAMAVQAAPSGSAQTVVADEARA
jgi:hypothetical protein